MPLLASALGGEAGRLSAWGYVLLALAGSCIAANNLFAGSNAHFRYVTAQIGLEQLTTVFRLDWYKLQALTGQGEPNGTTEASLDLLLAFTRDVYKSVIGETTAWGQDVQQALSAYAVRVNAAVKASQTD